MDNLKFMEDIKAYVSDKSRDDINRSTRGEIFDLLLYDFHLCPTPREGIVLDVGANVGFYSMYALDRSNYVISMEPSVNCIPALHKNLESYTSSLIVEKGAWSSDGEANFSVNEGIPGCSRVVDSGSNVIPVVTIDHLMTELGVDKLDFIKMDIEGSEMEALAGASETIKRFQPRMSLSLYHKPTDEKDIINYIKSLVNYKKISIVSHTYPAYDTKIGYFYN